MATATKEKKTAKVDNRPPIEQLVEEWEDEEEQAAVRVTAPGGAPHDVWTLASMQKKLPLTGDLYEDGTFLFTFLPVLGSTYVQERFAIGRNYKPGTGQDFIVVQVAYAEMVFFCMKGCTWPVRETVTNEYGENVYDDQGVVVTVALPITLDNIKRMDTDMLVLFINAMTRAASGEANEKG